MESNINFSAIETYCDKLSDKLCNDFFNKKNKINGGEILSLTEIKQLNFFIVYELFKKWKVETDKLKSPFFDYDSPEVQKALTKFLNVLSKNILVDKDHFKPLLKDATKKSVLLIFSPYEYFKIEFDDPEKARLKYEELIELKKYLKVNQHLLNAYIKRFEEEGIEEIFNDNAIRIFDEVCENIKETPEDFEPFHELFNKIVPLDLDKFYTEQPKNTAPKDKKEEKDTSAKKSPKEEVSDKKTLNDFLQKPSQTLADEHQHKQIQGIKKNITINQRFMFVNELFKGDADEFESVVNFLDNCNSWNEAMDFVKQNYVEGKGWDEESEEVQEFMEILDKRFPN